MDVPHERQFTSNGYDGAGSWDCASLHPDVQPYKQPGALALDFGRAHPAAAYLGGGAGGERRTRLGQR